MMNVVNVRCSSSGFTTLPAGVHGSLGAGRLPLVPAVLRSAFLGRKKMLWGHKVVEMTDAFVDRALTAGYNVVYDTMGNEPNRFLRELMRRLVQQRGSVRDDEGRNQRLV